MKVVKVPSEQGSLEKNIGCAKAPDAIVLHLSLKADSVKVVPSNIEETDKCIYEKALRLLQEDKKPLFLGGDHSITYSTFSAFSKHFGAKNSALIIFDAHADAYQSFKPVSHEDMNRVLIEEKKLLPENLLLVGARKLFKPEREFLEKHSVQAISSEDVALKPFHSLQSIEEFLSSAKNLYLSIDIDVFDPSIAPGTGYLEEHGLLWKHFEGLLSTVLKRDKLRAADLVEFNPLKDMEGKTLALCGNIIKKLLQ